MRALKDNEVNRLRLAPVDWGELPGCPWGPALVVLERRKLVEVKLVEETWTWRVTEQGLRVLEAIDATS